MSEGANEGPFTMRRLIILLTILALGLLVACGGGDDDSSDPDGSSSGDSGSSSSSDSSSSSLGGSKDSFCTPEYADAVFEGFDPLSDTDDLEDTIKEMNSLLDRWADDAPSEIRGDVRIIVDAMEGFFEILEENDFDFMAMALAAEDDPRLAALDSADFIAATNRLNEYCGYEDTGSSIGSATAPSDDGGSSSGGFTQGTLPEDFPENLIPPDSTIGVTGDFGVGIGAEFTSTATVDDIIDFYKDALGDPTLSSSDGTIWSVFDDDTALSVIVSGTDGAVEIIATVSSP
jgi:hypothetical protein